MSKRSAVKALQGLGDSEATEFRVGSWSNSPEDRSKRAQHLLGEQAFQREIRCNQFLQKSVSSQAWFKGESFTRDRVQEMADSDGCRTAASWLETRKRSHRTIFRFVHEDAFKRLTLVVGWGLSPVPKAIKTLLLGHRRFSHADNISPFKTVFKQVCFLKLASPMTETGLTVF